jgi:hypothetical protein
MDMTRFLKPYLNVKLIEALGGDYENVIGVVTKEELRNKFRAQDSTEPVIHFLDGNRLVLNATMLRQCIQWFGPDSTNWVGRRLHLSLRRVENVNKETGEVRVLWHRVISCEDPHVRL